MRFDNAVNPFISIGTDSRKRFQVSLTGYGSRDWHADFMGGGMDLVAMIQAASNVDLSIGRAGIARTTTCSMSIRLPDETASSTTS